MTRASVPSARVNGTRSGSAASWTTTRPAEVPCLRRRQQALELAPPESTAETARDEDRLPLVGDAERRQLVEHGRERLGSRIDLRAGQRERGGLDDDGDATAFRHQVLERRARERKAQRIAHRRLDVDDARRRSGRVQTTSSSPIGTWTMREPERIGTRRSPTAQSNHRAPGRRRPASRLAATRLDRVPKTLTGEELVLDDGPARDAELFLVDGNNLAYRGFFALPEELQTTDGQPTNALLGFTNMLFKLLSDYRPRGVAVAWDTRPVHRKEIDAEYKAERRPMPDLLREQFPHFRPIVEAFGYSNLEFEGWEADDVIATLATQADEAGVKTCVVSTDRDAFQLVSENVCLMMTPRGVADVQVYTPERVEARYGIRPDQIPDFIGLKGDTSDNIPGIPGIGDKTAGQLIAQYGSLDDVVEHAGELSPARSRAIAENAEQARASKLLATMRRDLDLGVDPATFVLQPPGSLGAEGDLPPLRVPRPARSHRHAGRGASGRRAPAARDVREGAVARRRPEGAARPGGSLRGRRARECRHRCGRGDRRDRWSRRCLS